MKTHMAGAHTSKSEAREHYYLLIRNVVGLQRDVAAILLRSEV